MPDREERFNTATTPSESSSRGDPGYPTHLDRYEYAPDLLFVRGRLPQQPGVAIVGTRRCTSYGLELARAYGQAAAEAGWPVVSSLALGIDGEAHRGVVDVGGTGVVVLGCGMSSSRSPRHVSAAYTERLLSGDRTAEGHQKGEARVPRLITS